jgi:hypothetical protein
MRVVRRLLTALAAPACVAGLLVAPAGPPGAAESRDWAYVYLHDGGSPVGEPVTPPVQDSVTAPSRP